MEMWEASEEFEYYGDDIGSKRRSIMTPSGIATVSTNTANYTSLYIDGEGISIDPMGRLCDYAGQLTSGIKFEHLKMAARRLNIFAE